MHFSGVLSSAIALGAGALAQTSNSSVVTTGLLGDAVPVTNNPPGKLAIAILPEQPFATGLPEAGNIQGWVIATSGPNGVGANFEVFFTNLPPQSDGGAFLYHLHVDPVDETGNCTNTLGHLDPTERGESPICDPAEPATCQVGDLSGKHGAITSDPFIDAYNDPFVSMVEGPGSFFINRSLVIHFANTTRITCTDWEVVHEGVSIETVLGARGLTRF